MWLQEQKGRDVAYHSEGAVVYVYLEGNVEMSGIWMVVEREWAG